MRGNIDKSVLESLIREILAEKLGGITDKEMIPGGIIHINVPSLKVEESHRLDTGDPAHVVYTKDLFTIEESKRLGCGIMEMRDTTFNWNLNYDEIDYVIEGELSIIKDGRKVTAMPGGIILIPKGSDIQFSVKGHARFLYVTYPADWSGTV